MQLSVTDPAIDASQISLTVEDLDIAEAAAIYKQHGCLVVRGLMKP